MKILRYVLYSMAAVLVVAAAGFCYLYFRSPETAPPSALKVEMTGARIARGRYIYTLGDCDGCHSQRDFSHFGGPVVESGKGRGGALEFIGLPGRLVAPNITPDKETGLGAWTDGEKIRAIREGIGRDGRALFPLMPYQNFRSLSDEDAQSLIAYLNTLKPLRNELPKTQIDFPVSMFIKGAPRPVGTVAPKDRADRLSYGGYLVTIGGCLDCHTQEQRGQPVLSMKFAGGRRFAVPGMSVVSANITPDRETGIGEWDYARFEKRFRDYRPYVESGSPQAGPDRYTIMPWLNLSQLTGEDLQAIFTFLQTVTPVSNKVEKLKVG